MSQRRILILGQGAMGRMFSGLLRHDHHVSHWDRDPDSGKESEVLEQLAPGHDCVIFAVPAHPHAELAGRIADCLKTPAICLSIAKGLDADGHSPAEIFAQHFPAGGLLRWGLVYGPMIARDLSEGRTGFALAASPERETAEAMAGLFATTRLYLQPDDDPVGAAWAAILKNVYVPLIGMADGLGLGDNLRGFLLAEALRELATIVEARGGQGRTAYSLAGLGDLITTATSASSHHRGIGEALARGDHSHVATDTANLRSEGVNTAVMVQRHGLLRLADYPLFELTVRLLSAPENIETAILDFVNRRFGRTLAA